MTPQDFPFAEAARAVLDDVRGAYSGLLGALGAPARAADVQAALGLDKKLAWRVRKVADSVDPLEGASFVPSLASAGRVAQAALARGVERTIVDGVLAATETFEQFVADRAEDRSNFDAMAAALAGGLDPILLEARRTAFRANVVLHGKRSEALLFAFAIAPGPREGLLQAVSLRGHHGLQRLRADASTILSKHRFESDGRTSGSRRPLDPAVAAELGAPVVGALSSAELPALLHEVEADGYRTTLLAQSDLGPGGAATYLLGEVHDAFPLDEHAIGSLCQASTPTRRLVHDFLMHEDLPLEPPELRVVAGRPEAETWPEVIGGGGPGPEASPARPLAGGARVVDLGTGLGAARLPDWAGGVSPLDLAVARLGWDAGRMRLYRVVIEYPVQSSIAWLRARRR
ncbi:MAG: hypothetical protein AAFZ65_03175 [Planctomycetota bacterium]